MPRTGLLIGLAAVLIAAAAGVLVATNVIDVGLVFSRFNEKELGGFMRDVGTSGGVTATFAQTDIPAWQLAEGNKLERFALSGSATVFARLTSGSSLDKASVDWHKAATTLNIPLEFAQRTNGRTLEIGVIVRAAVSNGSTSVSIAYATQEAGNSGWQNFNLSPDFQLIKFKYKVPLVKAGYKNPPLIAFHSDADGGSRSIEMLGAYAKPVND